MKKILVVTGTRSEYGLLYWTMKEIEKDSEFILQLVVTGNHLITEYGHTIDEIKRDGFNIDEEIDMIINSEKKSSIAKSMGVELIQMAQCFERLKPDILLILGDRYETFMAAVCAMMMNIPIAHMNGGESTEGAIDEQIRHAITKMAHIHFPGAEYYKNRIIKMGEEPWRVHNVGQAGIENAKRLKLLGKKELEKELRLVLEGRIFLITYHPVTLDLGNIEKHINTLLDSLKEFDGLFIFTYPNADFGSKIIIDKINDFVSQNKNAYLYYSLGQIKYLSLLRVADVMVGNSSSGIIESPMFSVPVVNIGDRQRGRLRSNNIIDVEDNKAEIVGAIDRALNDKTYRNNLKLIENVYGEGNTSKQIVQILKAVKVDKRLLGKKLIY
jgi:GDP/UDP-N,N'-diacetylbacillosamine 2-epimerase (hydrolysing)